MKAIKKKWEDITYLESIEKDLMTIQNGCPVIEGSNSLEYPTDRLIEK